MTLSVTTPKLSVVMIVKNEAHNLRLSLPALDGLDCEIIILDSGSTDASQQIAQAHGARWEINTPWPGFGRQRQIAQSYARAPWILALDADEILTPTLKASIAQVIQTEPAQTVYGMRRIDCVFGQEIDHPWWAIKSHWRLYPRHFQYDDNLVHESLQLNAAATRTLAGFAMHQTGLTGQEWLQKRLEYAKAWAQDRFQKGKTTTLPSVFAHSAWAFIKQYIFDGRFLKGRAGLVYSVLFSHYTFNKYFLLHELHRQRRENASSTTPKP